MYVAFGTPQNHLATMKLHHIEFSVVKLHGDDMVLIKVESIDFKRDVHGLSHIRHKTCTSRLTRIKTIW